MPFQLAGVLIGDVMSTPAQSFVCPRCRTAFTEASQYCRQCGSDMIASPPAASGGMDATQPQEAISTADRRLSDSNQAWLGKLVDGRYRVLEVIGRGGMGVVYRVEHLRMGKIAAMKVLHRDLVDGSRGPARGSSARRHRSRSSTIRTPCRCSTSATSSATRYLIMEFVRGVDLGAHDRARRSDAVGTCRAAVRPDLRRAAGGARARHRPSRSQAGERADHAHDAAAATSRRSSTSGSRSSTSANRRARPIAHQIVGTPYFMAPEQIRGDEVDARTDIYSFGAMMFEVLTGQHLYPSSTAVGALTKHLTGEPDAPSMRNPKMGIPPLVDHVCRKALARDPAQRWQSASELASALEEAYAETVTETTGSRSSRSRGLRGPRLATDENEESDLRLRRSDIDQYERGLQRRRVHLRRDDLAAVPRDRGCGRVVRDALGPSRDDRAGAEQRAIAGHGDRTEPRRARVSREAALADAGRSRPVHGEVAGRQPAYDLGDRHRAAQHRHQRVTHGLHGHALDVDRRGRRG